MNSSRETALYGEGKFSTPLQRFAERRAMSLFVVLLVVVLFLSDLPHRYKDAQPLIFSVVVGVLLIVGSIAAPGTVKSRRVLLALAIPTIAFRWLSIIFPDEGFLTLDLALTLLLLFLMARMLLARVFDAGRVTKVKIEGAIALYLLIGAVWSRLYILIALHYPDAFQFAVPPATPFELNQSLIYFSFASLTTVGYGDISPVLPLRGVLPYSNQPSACSFRASLLQGWFRCRYCMRLRVSATSRSTYSFFHVEKG